MRYVSNLVTGISLALLVGCSNSDSSATEAAAPADAGLPVDVAVFTATADATGTPAPVDAKTTAPVGSVDAAAAPATGWTRVADGPMVLERVGFCGETFYILGTGTIHATKTGIPGAAVNAAPGFKLDDIACGTGGQVIVVGKKNTAPFTGIILRSIDKGESWQNVTAMNVGTERLENVTFGNGKFWVTGLANTLLSSADGLSFTATPAMAAGQASFNLVQIAYGNGVFVGFAGAFVFSSTDASLWTYKMNLGETPLRALFLNGAFWAVGARKFIATSTDGMMFAGRTVPSSTLVNATFNDITFGKGIFTIVGSNATILRSTDGLTFDKDSYSTPLGVQNLYGVAAGADRRVTVGSLGMVLTAP